MHLGQNQKETNLKATRSLIKSTLEKKIERCDALGAENLDTALGEFPRTETDGPGRGGEDAAGTRAINTPLNKWLNIHYFPITLRGLSYLQQKTVPPFPRYRVLPHTSLFSYKLTEHMILNCAKKYLHTWMFPPVLIICIAYGIQTCISLL